MKVSKKNSVNPPPTIVIMGGGEDWQLMKLLTKCNPHLYSALIPVDWLTKYGNQTDNPNIGWVTH